MDKLADLPPKETQLSEQENGVLKKYFGETSSSSGEDGTAPVGKPGWIQTFKLALYASILFIALCNPITDGVFCRLPYCGEGVVSLLAAKTLIFMISFVAMYKFLF